MTFSGINGVRINGINGVRPPLVPACLDEGVSECAVFLLHGVGGGKEAWPDAMKSLVGAYRRSADGSTNWEFHTQSRAGWPFFNTAFGGSLKMLIFSLPRAVSSEFTRI